MSLSPIDKKIKDLYLNDYTDEQIGETVDLHQRTVRRHLGKMRKKGLIGYREQPIQDHSSAIMNMSPTPHSDEVLNETELIKMLEIHGTRTAVAKRLGVSVSVISRLCDVYQIIDTKRRSLLLNESLDTMLKDVKPYVVKGPDKQSKGDTLVVHLTDSHCGKVVKDQDGEIVFDQNIFLKRFDKLSAQILKLLDRNIKRGVKITDVVVFSTGDLANGENIYATQSYEQEFAPPKQVMMVVEEIMKLINSFRERGLKVNFYGVPGNHGNTGKDADPASNWDLMIYKILKWSYEKLIKAKDVSIRFAETDYMVVEVRGHIYLLRHKAPQQSDTASGRVKFNQWARQHGAEAIVYGHFHHFGFFDCDGVRVFRGGSVVGGDSLSERMSKDSDPCQLVWGVNSKRVSTFLYVADLAD